MFRQVGNPACAVNAVQVVVILSALSSLALATGCEKEEEADEDRSTTASDALWERLHDEDYESWARAPGYDEPQDTVRAHRDTALIFLNDVAETARAAGEAETWPDGSVLVKQSFEEDGTQSLIGAMSKENGEWYWVEWEADGTALYEGQPEICTDCHESGVDFVKELELGDE